MGGVGSVSAWVRGWRETNFGIGRLGRFGSTKFLCRSKKKKMAGVEILVWVKHDIMNFCYDSMQFYL